MKAPTLVCSAILAIITLTGCVTRPPHRPVTISVQKPDVHDEKLASILQAVIQDKLQEAITDTVIRGNTGDIVIVPTIYITSVSTSASTSKGALFGQLAGGIGGAGSGSGTSFSGEYIAEMMLEAKKGQEVLCMAGMTQTPIGGIGSHCNVVIAATEALAEEMDKKNIVRAK